MKKILLAGVGLILVLLFMRPPQGAVPVRVDRLALGTLVTVKLYEEEGLAGELAQEVFAEIDRIDSLMSRHIETSEANRLERLAASGPTTCSLEMARVLARSQKFAYSSDGAFDITIGALTRLWNFPDVEAPPAAARIDSALALTGYRTLQLEGRLVSLSRPGIRLDLGGSAKGFAVDRAVELLRERGIERGLIEAGGDIRYWGKKPDGRDWRFGIQHPREQNRYIQVEDLGLNAIATSGDYEQNFAYEGQRYHHILDPATGYPATKAISATAWAGNALDADILSTSLFILGPERGLAWIETLPDAEGLVFVFEGDQLHHRASSGVEGRFTFPEIDK